MKFISTLILVFSVISILNAQDKGYIEFGFGGGLNLANVSELDGDVTNQTTLVAFNVGGSGEYYFSDRWGIKLETIYDQKGWADGFFRDANGFAINTDYMLDYISVPVMANYHFNKKRSWYLNFGPYVGFLLNAEDSSLGMDFQDFFQSTDIGFAAGIGHKLDLNENMKLFIEFDSQSGFSDVFENNNGDAIVNGRSSFNIGLLFGDL